ncbi:MAG: GntR family transcriptional regulator [Candidatus Cloacimonetes bacterium]|nr:GntR family transcriptional regulator [Candidatus Cloacimonadota bacterium]
MRFDEGIPIYLQIKEKIEDAIISRSLREDEVIPSIRVLAQQYRLNPQTVSNAFNELISEGFLYKKRGIGMFVEKGAQEKLQQRKSELFRKTEFIKVIAKGKTLGIKKNEIIKIIDNIYDREDV